MAIQLIHGSRVRGVALALALLKATACGEVPDNDSGPDFFGGSTDSPSSEGCVASPGDRVTYTLSVLDWETHGAPSAISVRACERADLGCDQPVSSAELPASSEAQAIHLPKGFGGVLEFRAGAALSTVLWLPHPLCRDEHATLPVWLFPPDSIGPPSRARDEYARSNHLLLQRIGCTGLVEPFPPPDRRALVRVSPAGATTGERWFVSYEGRSREAPIAPAADAPGQFPVRFHDLPEDQDLALEVFDFVDQYAVLQLRVSSRQTSIASVLVSDCSAWAYEPR